MPIFARNRPLLDGELLGRRLTHFLTRMNTALAGAAQAMPDFDIEGIEVSLSIDTELDVGFANLGGSLDRERTFTFSLKPKALGVRREALGAACEPQRLTPNA
jgi:hypothetical protein